MLLKFIELHNKALRNVKDPIEMGTILLKKGYFLVGVSVHNDENVIKGKKHFYALFEHYFEKLEKMGILMLPSIEIKIRKENYEDLDTFIELFSKKFIPVKIKGNIHHIPFLIMVHGGKKEINRSAVQKEKVDILCHPGKGEGYFTKAVAKKATKNNVGIELNYREYLHSDNKDKHKKRIAKIMDIAYREHTKVFLNSAAISHDDIVHIQDLIAYGNSIHPHLVEQSLRNTISLVEQKYGHILEYLHFSEAKIRKRLGL